MDKYKLGLMETKFANLIWDNAPIKSGDLVKLCEKEFEWKKSTTHTMLRRLCQRDIFANENGTVKPKINKQEFQSMQTEFFIKENFNNSLPNFITAFVRSRKLSEKEIYELEKIINKNKG